MARNAASDQLWRHLRDIPAASLLAFIGGFVDAAGFLGLFGIFTSSITGNLVVAAAAATQDFGVLPRVVVTIVFVAGAAVSSVFAICSRRHHTAHARTVGGVLLTAELLFISAAWLAGALLDRTLQRVGNVDTWPVYLLGSLLAFAMGLQNGAVREAFAGYPPTTVMTSTLVNTGGTAAAALLYACSAWGCWPLPTAKPAPEGLSLEERVAAARAEHRRDLGASLGKLATLISPLISFLVGAALGALTFYYGRWHSLAIPVAVLAGLLLELAWAHKHHRRPVEHAAPLAAQV